VVQMPEIPLSDRGQAQAGLLAKRLSAAGISRILASDYARAAMTAESLGAATGIGVDPEPLLRERNFGDLRGTRYDDLKVDLFGPDYSPPGGEDWETFHARVERAWEAIRIASAQTPGKLAVVTHGLVLYSLILRHLQLAPDQQPAMGFANTSLTVVGKQRPWRVELFNCSAHLEESTAHDDTSVSGI